MKNWMTILCILGLNISSISSAEIVKSIEVVDEQTGEKVYFNIDKLPIFEISKNLGSKQRFKVIEQDVHIVDFPFLNQLAFDDNDEIYLSKEQKTNWEKYFQISPATPSLGEGFNKRENFSSLLRIPEPILDRCGYEFTRISEIAYRVSQLDRDKKIFLSSLPEVSFSPNIEKINLRLHRYSQELSSLKKNVDSCRTWAYRVYLVESLHLLLEDLMLLEGTKPKTLSKPFQEILLFSIMLINRLPDSIRFIDDAFREGQKSSLWRKKTDSYYHILGGYDCQEAIVYLDPSLPPLNLAGIFIQELDHLLRDKLQIIEWSGQQPLLSFSNFLGVQDYIFSNELYSVTTSAFLQKLRDGVDPRSYNWNPEIRSYRSVEDFRSPLKSLFFPAKKYDDSTLHSEDGPLSKLMALSTAEENVWSVPNFFRTLNPLKNNSKNAKELRKLIRKEYFDSKNGKLVEKDFSRSEILSFTGFKYLLENYSLIYKSENTAWNSKVPLNSDVIGARVGSTDFETNFTSIFSAMSEFEDAMNRQTPICLWLQSEANKKNSEIHKYLGYKLGVQPGGGTIDPGKVITPATSILLDQGI